MYLESLSHNEFDEPLDWLPEKFYWLGQNEALFGPREDYRVLFEKFMAIFHSLSHH
jgi:hypothetical protein